jgi:4-hydroxymandelate oxidase
VLKVQQYCTSEVLIHTNPYRWEHGGEDEETFHANGEAWRKFVIRPQILTDVSAPSMETKILGHTITLPLCLAPVSFHSLADAEAELATARAAAAQGIGFGLSTAGTTDMAVVADAAREVDAGALLFYQLYVPKEIEGHRMDRDLTQKLLRYAEGSSYAAVLITVDQQAPGNRWRTTRDREWTMAIGRSHGGLPRSRVAEGIKLNAVPAGLCASVRLRLDIRSNNDITMYECTVT